MEEKNNPLSPHLQIYKWQISSLLSITHRIVGVINIIAITIICFWSFVSITWSRELFNY
jgi:succinate dehydrogenase / fumarate reductase cytochrome b subunit